MSRLKVVAEKQLNQKELTHEERKVLEDVMQAARICIFLLAAGGALWAQHEADPAEGARLFRLHCAVCHGPLGNAGGGGIDLLHAKFKRPSSDADIVKYVRAGIPGTAMMPMSLPEAQLADIIAYMRATASAPASTTVAGDPARGKAVIEGKGGCLSCHNVRGAGSHFGPDLTDIGAARRPDQLERSILDPDVEIIPANRVVRVVTNKGVTVTGRLLNQDTFTIQIIDAKEQLQTFEKSALREFGFAPKSPMPSARGKLSAAEVADLVGYLATLKSN